MVGLVLFEYLTDIDYILGMGILVGFAARWLLCSGDQVVGRLLLLLGDLLEEGVDDGDGEHDTRTATDGTHEVCKDAESADTNTTEGSSNVNVASQVLDH